MIITSRDKADIRVCTFERHCKEITIFRVSEPSKVLFSGYGILKMNENGALYVEFVCNKDSPGIDYNKPIPENRLIAKEKLAMKAVLLDGEIFTSEGFRIRLNVFSMPIGRPVIFNIALSEIVIASDFNQSEDTKGLYFEFEGDFKIPRNVSNRTESTTGSSSHSWNQSSFSFDSFKVDIIRHKKYTSVSISGSDYSFQDVEDALKFYFGFSTGFFPQEFYSQTVEGSKKIEKIVSVNKQILSKFISPPICHAVYDSNDKPLDKFHFDLFKNIINQIKLDRKAFESIYSQWSRVWHASLSPEIGVLTLSLSVSIEGVLNDIYINVITDLLRDNTFESKKVEISKKIDAVDYIEEDHKKMIIKYVDGWGNIYPKKALIYLAEIDVITKEQVASWVKLRNSAAHPRLMHDDETRRIKDVTRTFICLGLFYRLILNVFRYEGAQYAYEYLGDERLIQFEYIPVLDGFISPSKID